MVLLMRLTALLDAVAARLEYRRQPDAGFSTAELLGNAALGVAALFVIWGLLRQLGVDVVTFIRAQMFGG